MNHFHWITTRPAASLGAHVITDVIYVPKKPLPHVTHHVGTLWYLCCFSHFSSIILTK